MYQGSSPDHDASSSCSAASPGGDSPARSGQPPPADSLSSASSMDSISQDPDTSASDSFVPTVTAISTSPGLRWMVQPTVITSSTRSPSRGAARAKARSKEQTAGKKGKKDQPSKEEEERRKIRRERNKIAAAKCRNRRRELTDTLQAETDTLEDEKAALQTEIADLLKEKERLEQVLASHKPVCTLHPTDDHRDDEVDDAAAAAGMDDEVEADKDDDDVDADGGEDDVSPMQQDPPASPPPLSMWPESESLSEETSSSSSSMTLLLDSPPPAPQDLDHPPSTAAAILGNSNILLCSSAEEEEVQEEVEPLEDLKGDDLDALVPSLEMSAAAEEGSGGTAPAVPDIDLGGAFGLPDWETLYRSVARDLESLATPLVSSSPTCGGGDGFRSVFSFSGPEMDSLQTEDDCLALRGPAGGGAGGGPGAALTKDSLNSPTMLAL